MNRFYSDSHLGNLYEYLLAAVGLGVVVGMGKERGREG